MTGRVLLLVLATALAATGVAGAVTKLPGFRSPSGNISCLFIPGPPHNVQCQIAHADYAKTLQARCLGPSGGGVDWHGFTLTATGRATVVCSGRILYNPTTERPSYVTLPYGKSERQGVFTCLSQVAGVTCRNRTGHGVFISRQSWRVW